MAQRVTVTISDSLAKRLDAVKANFNISAVCQEAIEHEVTRQELIQKGSEDMDNVIERLKMEKEKYNEQYIEQGRKDGYSDGKKMEYDEIMEIVNGNESIYRTEVYFGWLQDEIKDLENYNDGSFDENAYLQGWVEGVKSFWEEIKDQL